MLVSSAIFLVRPSDVWHHLAIHGAPMVRPARMHRRARDRRRTPLPHDAVAEGQMGISASQTHTDPKFGPYTAAEAQPYFHPLLNTKCVTSKPPITPPSPRTLIAGTHQSSDTGFFRGCIKQHRNTCGMIYHPLHLGHNTKWPASVCKNLVKHE